MVGFVIVRSGLCWRDVLIYVTHTSLRMIAVEWDGLAHRGPRESAPAANGDLKSVGRVGQIWGLR